jgi:hypothetical protein
MLGNLHRLPLRFLAALCIVFTLSPTLALAQEPAPSVQSLRQQIALMEKIENDPSTTNEVRQVNRTLLAARKKQLAALLAKEIDALVKYQAAIGESLSADERATVGALLNDLKAQLGSLQSAGETPKNSNEVTATASGGSSLPPARTETIRESQPTAPFSNPTVVSNHSPAASPPQNDKPPACYADAPITLLETARGAGQLLLRGEDPTSQFNTLVFFAITHVVAVDDGHEELLKSIEVRRLKEETKRTDKQIGSPASAAGSTSAIEKPSFAEILGFGIEHGGIQQAVNGTTLHLSTTPYALFGAFRSVDPKTLIPSTLNNPQTSGVLASYDTQTNYKKYGYLTRLGISADFNIENQDDLLANARRKQLADWSLRLRLTKDRSTRSTDAEQIWNDISPEFARPALVMTQMLADTFQTDPQLEAKRREISSRFISLTADPSLSALSANTTLSQDDKLRIARDKIICQIKTDIVDQIHNPAGTFKIPAETRRRIVDVTLPAYAAALSAKDKALNLFDEEIEKLSYKPILTFAYDNVRPVDGANYSHVRLLFEKKTGNPMNLIANGGISFYHNPNRARRQQSIRDFSAALSFEGTAGRSPFLIESEDENPITYSFTGRYQRILENRFIPGRKADIAVGQFKLTIPVFAGMSFPVSVTFANASELIKEKHVGANFGFTFDTDKLLKAVSLSRLKSQ